MRIPCPYCGERSNDEFAILGDAAALLSRPADGALPAFDAYVHQRANPAGMHTELWYHQAGCRRWLVVTRDTRTHVIHNAAFAETAAGTKA